MTIPPFNEAGELPPGEHTCGIAEFRDRYVTSFPKSISRREIFKGYVEFTDSEIDLGFILFQWLDGSYVTAKENPNDIDMVSFIEPGMINEAIAADALTGFEVKRRFGCHSFIVPIYPEGSPKRKATISLMDYWRTTFGQSRKGDEKGLILIDLSIDEQRNGIREMMTGGLRSTE